MHVIIQVCREEAGDWVTVGRPIHQADEDAVRDHRSDPTASDTQREGSGWGGRGRWGGGHFDKEL